MAKRNFMVGESTSRATGRVTRYFVTDANSEIELSERPSAAIFPVSAAYEKFTQLEHADKFCDYLNKLEEAAEVAYSQIHLVDILSRP